MLLKEGKNRDRHGAGVDLKCVDFSRIPLYINPIFAYLRNIVGNVLQYTPDMLTVQKK